MERPAVLRPPAGTGVDVALDLIAPARLHGLLHLPYLGKAAVPLCLVTGRNRAFGDRLLAFPVARASAEKVRARRMFSQVVFRK